jgi:hypothetical protein
VSALAGIKVGASPSDGQFSPSVGLQVQLCFVQDSKEGARDVGSASYAVAGGEAIPVDGKLRGEVAEVGGSKLDASSLSRTWDGRFCLMERGRYTWKSPPSKRWPIEPLVGAHRAPQLAPLLAQNLAVP